jgi:putative ABC transport system substrate-binding protein
MVIENFMLRQRVKNAPALFFYHHFLILFFCVLPLVCLIVLYSSTAEAREIKISILMASDVRQAPVDGLKNGLETHGVEEGRIHSYSYEIKNAAGDRNKLPEMAAEIIASKPDIAIACGGIEADALLIASAGTNTPVVFLSVSSSVERGIVASMVSSGNNFTGIDTNDTELTVKRLWFIRKILPDAKNVFCFNVPSIFPSTQSLALARQNAAALGFTIQYADVETQEDIKKATASLSRATTDVILMLPVAPTDKALQSDILPRAMAENIPIFGHGISSIEAGAFASYAGSRYANGQQAVHLIHKIIQGIPPREIPVETPENLELIINKNLVARLGLKIPNRVWRIADRIVDIQF